MKEIDRWRKGDPEGPTSRQMRLLKEKEMPKPELNLDAPVHPGAVPELGLGTLLKFAPIIDEVVQAVETALAGGAQTLPVIKFQINGRHVALGPTPVVVEP